MKKKVLFISIQFYEYIGEIKKAIEETVNAEVDCMVMNYTYNKLERLVNKLSRNNSYIIHKEKRLQKEFFTSVETKEYDYIFVLVGRGLYPEAFHEFMSKQKKAQKILYLWDDKKRVQNFENIKGEFDRIVSSDSSDCKACGFEFLPLFYVNKYRYENEVKDYDFSCTGEWHSNRAEILQSIIDTFPVSEYKWFALLSTVKKIYQRKHASGEMPGEKPWFIQFHKISMQENADILKRSKAVIDMPYASQSGLSIRTFEALAAKTKLITTNKNVINYDFYNESNVHIIDYDNPCVDRKFLETEYLELDKDIYEKYSINSWIKNLFKV